MSQHTVAITRFLSDFVGRRALLKRVTAASMGGVLAALGAPRVTAAFPAVSPPSDYTTLLGLCEGGVDIVTYTPGITNTDRVIQLAGTVTFSPPAAVVQKKFVTGYTYNYTQFASCKSVDDMKGTCVIRYTSGQSSTWAIDSWFATRRIGQYVGIVSGIISNGPFNNARVWQFIIRSVDDPSLCLTASGATQAHGLDTLVIAE